MHSTVRGYVTHLLKVKFMKTGVTIVTVYIIVLRLSVFYQQQRWIYILLYITHAL